MLSSSISSSSSSSSRSISLSPDSSCRKVNRIRDQVSSRMAKHLCQLNSKDQHPWLMFTLFLPCTLYNRTPRGVGEDCLSGLVWIWIWTCSVEQQVLQEGFVTAQAAVLLAFQNKEKPELSCLWEVMAHVAFPSSSLLCQTVAAPFNALQTSFLTSQA